MLFVVVSEVHYGSYRGIFLFDCQSFMICLFDRVFLYFLQSNVLCFGHLVENVALKVKGAGVMNNIYSGCLCNSVLCL